ncbi:adenine nucleotide alpha hydrolase family protein [Natrinema ejinorense]|uniref:Universal stress protein n=1 Tax=Natrinema ejinorense TaxID=373386 RepID=A0A2A5QQ50_9EURY|nr:universal stress protein [Natrinema ejinorense]PCR88986.1 universal stress protein [Natrinema ejinorense]
MTFVVPFDGSELAEAALVRAVEYGGALDESIAAVVVVPERNGYAREKGWIDENEPYDVDAVVAGLREQVRTLAPSAAFECERIREFPPEAELADHIERLILNHDPSVVFLGSDNVGRVVTPLTSVGVHVAAEESYDVFIVRRPEPPKLEALEPHSEFYRETGSTERSPQ